MPFYHDIAYFCTKVVNMSKIHIMASHVNNLTDARYFASWGADFIGFCRDFQHINYCDDDRIKEMIQWLEGPQYLLEFASETDQETILTMQEVTGISNIRRPSGIPDSLSEHAAFRNNNVIASEIIIPSTGENFPALSLTAEFSLITPETWDLLNTYAEIQPFFLEIPWQKAEEINAIAEIFLPFGLIFQGSNEEKTGMKSFDLLDDLFSEIQDLNS